MKSSSHDPTLLSRRLSRRQFLSQAAMSGAALGLTVPSSALFAQIAGERPAAAPAGVEVLNPLNRVPVSMIIDDSTCLVNLAHFCIPQFREVFPDRYNQPWRQLPREIPDAFVRKFGEWCHERGVKGKYSVIPHPACVGWIDREMPGWSKKELLDSLKLVRELMMPDWDIHPEMVSHTWVIDTKTGRPYEGRTEHFMENWRWTDGKSVDQLADYLGYALRILKNVDLPCEGVTTPGGFGNRVLPQLAQATLQSCRDVFQAEIPHYFRHLYTGDESVVPRVEYASGLDTPDPKCVVSIIGCTGDWFGGWDGLEPGSVEKFITEDLNGGRLPEVIRRGEPAIMVCHWPGIYYNGDEIGFTIFKEIVRRLERGYDNLIWMKLSEIARYWAAKELTRVTREGNKIILDAPFSTPRFTIRIPGRPAKQPLLRHGSQSVALTEASKMTALAESNWIAGGDGTSVLCFHLPKGRSEVVV